MLSELLARTSHQGRLERSERGSRVEGANGLVDSSVRTISQDLLVLRDLLYYQNKVSDFIDIRRVSPFILQYE